MADELSDLPKFLIDFASYPTICKDELEKVRENVKSQKLRTFLTHQKLCYERGKRVLSTYTSSFAQGSVMDR